MTQPLHVLLVEAAPISADSLEPRLKRSGYRTSLARSADSALETAQADPPDLIVLDVGASDLDGHKACRELKLRSPTLPVIMYAEPSNALSQNDCGADEFVLKPADPALVMQKIVQLLGR
ncbi:MAG: response regulator [Polyangiales bacterium]